MKKIELETHIDFNKHHFMSQVNLDKNNAYFLNLEEVLEDGYKLPKRKRNM
jgi:hypothetical protein